MNYADKYKAALIQSLMPGQNQQNRHWLETVGNIGRTAAGAYLSKQMAEGLKARQQKANAAIMGAMQPQTGTQNLQVQAPAAVSGPQAGAMGGSPVGEPGERPGFKVPMQVQKPASQMGMLAALGEYGADASPFLSQAAAAQAFKAPKYHTLGEGEALVSETGDIVAQGPDKIDEGSLKVINGKLVQVIGGKASVLMEVPKDHTKFEVKEDGQNKTYIGNESDKGTWKLVATSPIKDPEDTTFAQAATLRKEFNGLKPVQDYKAVLPAIRSAYDTAGRNSRASDINLVFAVGKTMDPSSVVREGEQVMVQDAGSLSDRLKGLINSVNGGARLTATQRAQLLMELKSRADAHRVSFMSELERYRGIAEGRGLNVDEVTAMPGDLPAFPTEIMGSATGNEAGPPASKRYNPETQQLEDIY